MHPAALIHQNGLWNLLHVLDVEFGPEDQELQEDSLDKWEKVFRSRGQSLKDFLVDFDIGLQDASDRGYMVGPVALTRGAGSTCSVASRP